MHGKYLKFKFFNCSNSYLPKLYCFINGTSPRHWIYFRNHLHKRSPLNNLVGRTPLRYKQPTSKRSAILVQTLW